MPHLESQRSQNGHRIGALVAINFPGHILSQLLNTDSDGLTPPR